MQKLTPFVLVLSAAICHGATDGEISVAQEWAGYIRQGGLTMVFIGLLSVLGFGCAIERLVNLRRSRIVPDGFTAKVIELWKAGKTEEVAALCSSSKSMLARVVETMLQHRESGDYAEVKLFAEDKAGRELRLENRKASMLSTAATLAPLLGLSDVIVDIVETGKTLRENDLEVKEEIAPISARFIANKSAYPFKTDAIRKMAVAVAKKED